MPVTRDASDAGGMSMAAVLDLVGCSEGQQPHKAPGRGGAAATPEITSQRTYPGSQGNKLGGEREGEKGVPAHPRHLLRLMRAHLGCGDL